MYMIIKITAVAVTAGLLVGGPMAHDSVNNGSMPATGGSAAHGVVYDAATDAGSEVETRAAVNGKVSVYRQKKNRKPSLTFRNIKGKTTVRAFVRDKKYKRLIIKTKNYTLNGKAKKVNLHKRTSYVEIVNSGYKTRKISIANKRVKFNRSIVKVSKPSAKYWDLSKGSKNDWVYMSSSKTIGFDTCEYSRSEPKYDEEKDVFTRSKVTAVHPSKTIYWRTNYYGGKMDSTQKSYLNYAFKATSAVTGYRFVYITDKKRLHNVMDFTLKNVNGTRTEGYASFSGSYDGGVVRNAEINISYGKASSVGGKIGVTMHEIGHALGLGHAKSSSQIMHDILKNTSRKWSAGDYAGLKKAAYKGCNLKIGSEYRYYDYPDDY